MYAEIIAIGSELTSGAKLDTNSQWLSSELESLGWTVIRHSTLADDIDSMIAEFRNAANRSQVVLITGGLGPTLDDITRDALAAAFKQSLIRDPDSLAQIEALFQARGKAMPERNQRQADRPEHAQPLPNRCGTAPGILLRTARADGTECLIAVMPGVPAEMRPMFEREIKPQLPGSGMVLSRRVLRTFGYGESEAERMLGDLTARGRNPEVGITASEAVISLWVSAREKTSEMAEASCEATMQLIRERLGESVYGEGAVELHEVVVQELQRLNLRIALIEGATTGGLLSLWLTEQESFHSVIQRAEVRMGRWPDPQLPASAWPGAIPDIAKKDVADFGVDFVLMSSPFEDTISETGVTLRQGWIAVAGVDHFETIDVTMSGNLAIFRQRAARTALNRLRLRLANSSK